MEDQFILNLVRNRGKEPKAIVVIIIRIAFRQVREKGKPNELAMPKAVETRRFGREKVYGKNEMKSKGIGHPCPDTA